MGGYRIYLRKGEKMDNISIKDTIKELKKILPFTEGTNDVDRRNKALRKAIHLLEQIEKKSA